MCDNCPTSTADITVEYSVTGMTCSHCENAVIGEIAKINGITQVTAQASTGLVTITSDADVPEAALRAAVDEAGYELAGRH